MRSEHVVIGKEKVRAVGPDHISGIEVFWCCAKNRLYPMRGVPQCYLHLYPAEVCSRFNHRGTNLTPLLLILTKSTGIRELNPVQVRKAWELAKRKGRERPARSD